MTLPLASRRVALAEGRQLEELADLLAREGAEPLRYPLVSIVDAPDPSPAIAWLRDLAAGRFDFVIFFTGEGVRRLLALAQRLGLQDEVIAALARARTMTRGPKPLKALKEVGLIAVVADAPTTDGVIATLRREPLAGKVVGVQLAGEANPPLTEFLTAAGATAHPVVPYVYAPGSAAVKVAELIDRLAAGAVDAIVFTSSPQVERLAEVAAERELNQSLAAGLARTCVAAVGPVVADSLHRHQVRVDVCPEQGFVMKNLVQQLKRYFASRPAS